MALTTIPDEALLAEVLRRWPELALLRFDRKEPRREVEVTRDDGGRWHTPWAVRQSLTFAEAVADTVARVRQ